MTPEKKNDLDTEEVESAIHSVSYNTPNLFEKCDDSQNSNSVKIEKVFR